MIMRLLTTLIRFVQYTSLKNNIDESHALGHAMKVLYYTHQNYLHELPNSPQIKGQETVMYSAAILHDMYDHKYETKNVKPIQEVLQYQLKPYEVNAVEEIINSMSYSKVKTAGFPELGKYQVAYHIVREADILASYDIDRAIIYDMYRSTGDIHNSYDNMMVFFENRVKNYHKDYLFMTDYGKKMGDELRIKSIDQITSWKSIINTFDRYI